jgi:phage protein D
MNNPRFTGADVVFIVDGRPDPDMARDCVRLRIDERRGRQRILRLRLSRPRDLFRYLDGRLLDFGNRLAVSIGLGSGLPPVFDGVISSIQADFPEGQPPTAVLGAEDALIRLRMCRRTQTFRNIAEEDIARKIAAEHRLTLETQLLMPSTHLDVVEQVNQTDLAFLRERARLLGAELSCVGETLRLDSQSTHPGTTSTLIRGEELLSIRLLADLDHQRRRVIVTGRNSGSAGSVERTAGADEVEKTVPTGRIGPRIVEHAVGPDSTFRVRDVAPNPSVAQARANVEMLRRATRFVTAVGMTRGSPEISVGSRVLLKGVGVLFDGGDYFVTRTRHTLDMDRGLRTTFEAERANINAPPVSTA